MRSKKTYPFRASEREGTSVVGVTVRGHYDFLPAELTLMRAGEFGCDMGGRSRGQEAHRVMR